MKPVVLVFCGSRYGFRDGVKKLVEILGETPLHASGGVMGTEERIYTHVRSKRSVAGYNPQFTSFVCWEPQQESFTARIEEADAIEYLINRGIKQERNDFMNDRPQIEMPKYVSHKEVHALKIASVDDLGDGNGCRLHFTDTQYASIDKSEEWQSSKRPEPGGYYVVYKDGYSSYSPAEAFEEGYTRI